MLRYSMPMAALLLGTTALHAEVYDLEEITISANRQVTKTNQTGATVEIVNAKDIQSGAIDAGATLDQIPGLSYSTYGGTGSTGTIRIRGLDSRYIGVRIDGIDVTDPSSTQVGYKFGGLLNSGLGRIEVLKGSQSALYGSEAIGGVINITSAVPTENGTQVTVGAEAGSYKTYLGYVEVGHKSDKGHATLYIGRVTSEGFSSRSSDTEADGYRATQIRATVEHQLADAFTAGAAIMYKDGVSEYDLSTSNSAGTITQKETGARVYGKFTTGAVEHELSFSTYKNDRYDAVGYTKAFVGTRNVLEYVGRADLSPTVKASFGLTGTEEKATLDSTKIAGRDTAVFGELLYTPTDGLELALSARHDKSGSYGSKTTYRAALSYELPNDVILRAVAGTGFRAPSLYEAYGPYSPTTFKLKPESSVSYELGVEKRYENGSFAKATVFNTEVTDLIDWGGSSYSQVAGTSKTRGIELSGEYVLNDRTALFGSFTYTDAKDKDGNRLARVPAKDLVLGVKSQLSDRVKASLSLQHVADRYDLITWPNVSKVADYTVVNVSASYAISDKAEAYIRIENLGNQKYQTSNGYNQAGRSAYFGVRATF